MPRQLSSDDLAELKALRQVFDYGTSLKRLEDYGKWIFTAVASITALGAGFSNSSFKGLSGPGKIVFAVAIIFAGTSLSSASLLLSPKWQTVNRWSRDSLRNALFAQFKRRRRSAIAAGVFLSLALVLAGIAPGVSALFPTQPSISRLSYAFSKGTLEITLSLANVAPDSDAALMVDRVDNQNQSRSVARVVLHADQSGIASRTIQISAVPATYKLLYSCRTPNGQDFQSKPETLIISAQTEKEPSSSPSPKTPASGQKAKSTSKK